MQKVDSTGERITLDPSNDIPIQKIEPVYTVAGTYDKSNGKFSQIFGNVAIVDCSYFFYDVLKAAQVEVNKLPIEKRLEYTGLILAVKAELKLNNVTICEFPFEIDGVLNN